MLTRYWRCWVQPGMVGGIVLASVFVTEYTVMLSLPWLLPREPSRFLEATVDACFLTVVLAPLLWRTVVQPLQEVIRLRTRYLTDLFARVETNKKKVAHELHDGVGQTLSLLVSGLRSAHSSISDPGMASRCEGLLTLAQTALKDVKRLAVGLRPSLLDDLGLAPALERLASDIREQRGLELTLDLAGLEQGPLPEGADIVIFRIVQEALSNVVAHAHAKKASVLIGRMDGELHIEIADDGVGFPAAEEQIGRAGHLGLLGMRERTALFGGQFGIVSTPGRGTRIEVAIPVKG